MKSKIISKTKKIYISGKSGYSVKNTFSKIKMFLEYMNTNFDYSIAKTGSIYISFLFKGIYYELRISNHTKATFNDSFTDLVKKLIITSRSVFVDPHDRSKGSYKIYEIDYEVIDTETKNVLFKQLGINKIKSLNKLTGDSIKDKGIVIKEISNLPVGKGVYKFGIYNDGKLVNKVFNREDADFYVENLERIAILDRELLSKGRITKKK